jgi:hypothetical protein
VIPNRANAIRPYQGSVCGGEWYSPSGEQGDRGLEIILKHALVNHAVLVTRNQSDWRGGLAWWGKTSEFIEIEFQ